MRDGPARDPESAGAGSYRRTRRLAYATSIVSFTAILLWMTVGHLPDALFRPVLIPDGADLLVLHGIRRGDREDVIHSIARCDPGSLSMKARATVFGDVTAGAADGRGAVIFYGKNWSRVDADSTRPLPVSWTVSAAAGDAAGVWAFGLDEETVRAVRLKDDVAGPVETVAEGVKVFEKMSAVIGPDGEPVLFWTRNRALQVSRRPGGRWTRPEETGQVPSPLWTPVTAGDRLLLISMHPEDRGWLTLPLRVHSIPASGPMTEIARWTLQDSPLQGRLVTGLAATSARGPITLCVTRPAQIHAGIVPIAAVGTTLAIETKPLIPVSMPARVLPAVLPFFMSALAILLIYFGFAMIRERERIVLAALGPPATLTLRPARVLPRMMAFLIDFLVILPLTIFALDWLDFTSLQNWLMDLNLRLLGDTAAVESVQMTLVGWMIYFLYFSLLEGATAGTSIGKRLLGLRVTRLDGSPIDLRHAVARNLNRLLDPYGLIPAMDVLVMMFHPQRRRIGDLIGRTLVQERRLSIESTIPAADGLDAERP